MRVSSCSSTLRRFRPPDRSPSFVFTKAGLSCGCRGVSGPFKARRATAAAGSFSPSFFFSSGTHLLAHSRRCLALSSITGPVRCLSTLQLEDEETLWVRRMGERYGLGNYQLFRPLYKDLCDEMRNEYWTKPPPPLQSADLKQTAAASQSCTVPSSNDAGGGVPSKENANSELSESDPPRPTYGDGSWSVTYDSGNNIVTFQRDAIQATRQARVVAYAAVEIKDPPKLNAMLTFLDWYPIEVLVLRKGVILHFSIACNEGGMHMRNVRAYDAAASPLLMQCTDDAQWVRQNLFYDGPCLWHLELDFQNELYDVMQDHGVDLDWVRWAAQWIFYLEHVNYTRWSLGMLEELIPSDQRGPEEDFLLQKEMDALSEPVEESLSGRGV